MSKSDKGYIEKPADLKRIDPPEKVKSRHKKQYPPHWKVYGWSHQLWASKCLRTSEEWHHIKIQYNGYVLYSQSDEMKNIRDFLNAGLLDCALEIYTKHHPETANWPVRFINIAPMNTTREILCS